MTCMTVAQVGQTLTLDNHMLPLRNGRPRRLTMDLLSLAHRSVMAEAAGVGHSNSTVSQGTYLFCSSMALG